MSDELNVVGLCGSLRAASINRKVLEAAGSLMPQGMHLTIESFAQLSIYSADEQEEGFPEAVLLLGDAIRAADAVVISSPEYNFGVPGGLKNAIDWISRLPEQPFKEKPVAIMGGSPGPLGTARMQYDLRRILQCLEADVLSKPEVFVGNALSKFDDGGVLVDALTRKFIGEQMAALQKRVRDARALRSPAA